VDVADYDNSGKAGIVITNFDNEMIGLYRYGGKGYDDVAMQAGIGPASKNTLGFGCVFFDANLDGLQEIAIANGHIDETVRNIRGNVGYAQAAQLFQNLGGGQFRDVAPEIGGGFDKPKVGRGLAIGDFDRDGDLDVLLTTNNDGAYLYRNDVVNSNRSIRFRLVGTKSNRDAIGAVVRIVVQGQRQMRMVRSGSSYLSQSELPVTFGIGQDQQIDHVEIEWPSGAKEEYKKLATGKSYQVIESKGITEESKG
jgi:enediyne biosynthesis protein E4